jgi:hypothetical protein
MTDQKKELVIKSNLSTPSLGITRGSIWSRGRRLWTCFQLPLSGSPTWQFVSHLKLLREVDLSFNSLSRDHRKGDTEARGGAGARPFNSLSRDHVGKGPTTSITDDTKTFNSLSRDHTIGNVEECNTIIEKVLSTPSLGITC